MKDVEFWKLVFMVFLGGKGIDLIGLVVKNCLFVLFDMLMKEDWEFIEVGWLINNEFRFVLEIEEFI